MSTLPGLLGAQQQEIIKIVEDCPNPFLDQNPLKCLCNGTENGWGRGQTKWKLTVQVYMPVPAHTKKDPLRGVDWHQPIGTLDINFCKEGALTQVMQEQGSIVYRRVGHMGEVSPKVVINTAA